MREIEVAFSYSRDEYIGFERQFLFHSRRVSKFNLYTMPFVLAFAVGYLFFSGFSGLSILLLSLSAVFVALLAFIYIYLPCRAFDKEPKFRDEFKIRFTPEKLYFYSSSGNSEVDWSAFFELWENKGCFYLVQSNLSHTILPKRIFGDPAEFKSLVSGAITRTKFFK